MPEVLIVGAGPAGLHAALAAADHGAQVTLLDASDGLGGQFWRHLPEQRPAADEQVLHHKWTLFENLRSRLLDHPRCRVVTGAEVWAIEPTATSDACVRLHALVGASGASRREPLVVEPDRLVLATGAHDRVLPFPGWDLPGVYSAGAAQALAKGERVAVGARVLVAGSGPFLLAAAASLTATGADVVAVHEASRAGLLGRKWLARPWELVRSADKAAELAAYASTHLRHRIPYRTGSAVVAACGDDRVSSVRVARVDDRWRPLPGSDREIAVDAVCVSHGFTPRLELAIAAGCDIGPSRFVTVDDRQRSSVPGVYAAGELTGIGGMALSAVEGTIAGLAAAGADIPNSALAERARHRAFARRLAAAHRIGTRWTQWLDDDTIVCRCEEVPYAALHAPDTSRSLRSAKLTTRAGLGICQGRTCGRTVEEILDRSPGLLGTATTDRRPIAAPLRLAELAADPDPAPAEHNPLTSEGTS